MLNLNLIQMIANRLRYREEGQTFVEYAMLIGLVVIGLAGVFAGLSGALGGVVEQVDALLPGNDPEE